MSSDPKVVAGRGAKARGNPVPQHYPSNAPFTSRMPFSPMPGYQGPPHPFYPMHTHGDSQPPWPGPWNPAMGYPMPSPVRGAPVPPWIRPQGIRDQLKNTVPMEDSYTVDAIKRTYSNAGGAIEIQRVKVHRSAKEFQSGKQLGYPVFDTGRNPEMSLVPAGAFGPLNERRPPPRKNRKKKQMQQQNQMPSGPQGPYQWYPYSGYMPFSYPYPYSSYPFPGASETENSTEDNERSDSIPISFDDSQRLDSQNTTTRDSLSPDRSFSRASSSQITEIQSITPSDSVSVRGYKREHSMERALMAPTPPPRTRSRASEDFPSSEISKTHDWMFEMQKALAAAEAQRSQADNMSDKASSFTTAPSGTSSLIIDLDKYSDIQSSIEDTRSSADLSYSFGKFEKSVDLFRISLNSSPTNTETQTLEHSSESEKTPTGPEVLSIVPYDPNPIVEKTNPNSCLTQSENSNTDISSNTCMELVPVRPARAKRKTYKQIMITSENSNVIVAKDKVEAIIEEIRTPEIKLIDRTEPKDLTEVSVDNKEYIEPVDLNTSLSIDLNMSLDEVRISDISGLIRLEEEYTDGRLSSASTDTFHSLKTGDIIDTDSTDIHLPTSEAQTTADEGGNLTDSTAILSGGDGVGDDGKDYRWVLVQSGEAPELAPAPSEGSDDDRKNSWRAQVSLWRARLIVSLCRGRGLDRQDWATFNLMVHHPLTLDLKLSLLHASRLCQANSSVGAALVRVALIHLVTYGETLLQPEQARSHGWRSIRLDPSLPWAPVKGSVEILRALGYKRRDDVVLRYPRRSGPEVSVLARITLDMLVLSEELRLYLTGNHKYPSNVSDLFFPADSSDCLSPSPIFGENKHGDRPGSAMSYDFVSAHSIPSLDMINKREHLSSFTDDDTDTLQDSVRIVKEDSRKDSVEISSEEEPTLREDLNSKQETLDTKQLEASNVTLAFSEIERIKDPGKPPKSPVPRKLNEDNRTSISSLASSPLHFDRGESVATDVASLPDLHSIPFTPSPINISVTPVSTPGLNEEENILSVTPVPSPVIEEMINQPEYENKQSVTPVPIPGSNKDENKLSLTPVHLPGMEEMIKQPEYENKLSVTPQPSPVLEDKINDSFKQQTKQSISVEGSKKSIENKEPSTQITEMIKTEQSNFSNEGEEKKASPEPVVDHIYEEITEVRAKAAAIKATIESVAIVPPPLPPKKKVTSGDEDDCSLSLSYPPSNCSSLQGSLRGGSTGARRKKRRAPMPPSWISPDGKEENTSGYQSESPRTENKFSNIKKQESYDDSLNPFYEEIGNSNISKPKNIDPEKPLPANQGEIDNPFLEAPTAVGYIGKNPFYETITIKSKTDKKEKENPYESIDKVKEDIRIEIKSSTAAVDCIKDNVNEAESSTDSGLQRTSPQPHLSTALPDPPMAPPLPPKMKNQLTVSRENVYVQESSTTIEKANETLDNANAKTINVSIDVINDTDFNISKEETNVTNENVFESKVIDVSREEIIVLKEEISTSTVVSTSIEEINVKQISLSSEVVNSLETDVSEHDIHKINIKKENDGSMKSEDHLSEVEVKKNTEIQLNGIANSSVKSVDTLAAENAKGECDSNSLMSNKISESNQTIVSGSKDGSVIKEIGSGDKEMIYDDDDDDTMSQTSVGVLAFSLHEEQQSFPEQHNIAFNDFSLSIMEDDIDDTLSETLPLSDLEKEVIARVVERTASPQVPPELPPKQSKKLNLNKEQGIAPKASLEDMDEIPYIDVNDTNTSSIKEEGIPEGPNLLSNRASSFIGANVPFIDDLDEPPDCPPPPPPTSPPDSDSETPKASPQDTPHDSLPETPGNSPPETPHNSPPPSPTLFDVQEKIVENKNQLKEDIILKESLKKYMLGPERSISEDKYEIPDTSSPPSVISQTMTNATSITINEEDLTKVNAEVSKYTAQSESDKSKILELPKDEKANNEDSVDMEDRYEIPEVARDAFKIKVSQMPKLPPRPRDLPLSRRSSGSLSSVNPNKPPRRRNADTPPTPSSPTPPPPPRPPKTIDGSTPPALPPKSTGLPLRPASSTSHFSTASQTTQPSHNSSLLSSSSLFRSAAASSTSLFRSAASTPFGSVKSSASMKSGGSTPVTPPALRPNYKTNNGKGRKSWPQVFCNCLYANTKNYEDIS